MTDRRTGRRLALAAALLLAAACGWTLPEDLLFRWDARFWGGDAAFGWKGWEPVRGVDTILWLSAGGAWQNNLYFAGADDTDVPDPEAVSYGNWNADWRCGVAQGILFDAAQDRNLLEFLLFYRGKYHHYTDDHGLLDLLPERNGLLQNSIFTGLLFDSTFQDESSLTRRGIYSVLSAEFTPRWLGNDALGRSDFWRLSLILTGYQPVLESPAVSIYLAERLLLDRIFGDEVPVADLGSIGALTKVPIGSNPLRALGGAMRGVDNNRYDGYAKLVASFDVRLHFPSLPLFQRATPVAVAYFDAGLYDRMTGRLKFAPLYCATGLGVGLYALGFDFILYGTYFLNENRLSYTLGWGVHF